MFQGVSAFARRSSIHGILTLVMLALIGFSFSSFFSLVIIELFLDLPLLSDASAFDRMYDTENLGALKFMQLMNQLGLFGLPGLAFMWLAGLSKGKASSGLSWLPIILIPACALPLVTFLSSINENLPLLDDAITWMKANQEQANLLYENLLVMNGPGDLIINLMIMAIIPALAEETFFRGGLQQIFQRHTGQVHFAVWMTALLFSLAHFQFLTFIPRVVMGAALGYIFAWGGSLWMPILAHAINNGIAVLAFYLLADDPRMEQFDAIGATLDLWVMGSIVLLGGLFFTLNRFKAPDKLTTINS